MFQHIRKLNEHSALLLLLLLSADFAFIVLHLTNATSILNSSLFDITVEGGYAEIYQFVKLFWVVILLACVLKSTRCSGYVSWILVFMFFLLDDALQIHQNIGSHIAKSFGSYSSHNISLQPRHFGEWAVLAIAGTSLLTIVALAYVRGPYTFRKISNDMALFMAAFVFFNVFIDMTAAIELGPVLKFGLDSVENGGEMVVVSLILGYVFLLALHNGNPDLFLHDLLRKPPQGAAPERYSAALHSDTRAEGP